MLSAAARRSMDAAPVPSAMELAPMLALPHPMNPNLCRLTQRLRATIRNFAPAAAPSLFVQAESTAVLFPAEHLRRALPRPPLSVLLQLLIAPRLHFWTSPQLRPSP